MLGLRSQPAIDEPKSFDLVSAKSVEEAVGVLNEFGEQRSVILAGGCDLVDKLKNQWFTPEMVVNIKTIPGLNTIRNRDSGLEIGALATLTEIEQQSEIRNLYPALAQASGKVATPQIRNVGTIGGNLLQDSRCPYYRGPWNCYRHGGFICDAVRGFNAEHAIFGGERCYTVTPSDTASALVAFGAKVKIASASGERTIPIEKLFVPPGIDITHMHNVLHGEILTEILLPTPQPGTKSIFIKKAMRESWDFALASVVVVVRFEGDRSSDVRIVLGAVAPIPWRAKLAEDILQGRKLSEQLIEDAARASVEGAEPLEHNEYKIGLTKSIVRQALSSVLLAG